MVGVERYRLSESHRKPPMALMSSTLSTLEQNANAAKKRHAQGAIPSPLWGEG
jgi:hypothetical protein